MNPWLEYQRKLPIKNVLHRTNVLGSWRIFFELLDVAVLDLLHEGFAAEEVGVEFRGDLARDNEKLIVGCFGKRNGPARGNQMRAPLKNKPSVPGNQNKSERSCRAERGALRAEELREPLKQKRQAKNKDRSQ